MQEARNMSSHAIAPTISGPGVRTLATGGGTSLDAVHYVDGTDFGASLGTGITAVVERCGHASAGKVRVAAPHPNAYPNGDSFGHVRARLAPTPKHPDLHRRTPADAGKRDSGP
jgi:hypothetical protein